MYSLGLEPKVELSLHFPQLHVVTLVVQLLEFFRTAMSAEQYAALLPEPQTIQHDYGVDATTVLTLHRPLLALIQPPAVSGNDEEDGEIDAPKPMDTDALASSEPSPSSTFKIYYKGC